MASFLNTKSISHPNTFLLPSGSTQLIPEIGAINQAIRLILTTAKGELFGDPNFGSNLPRYTFDQADVALAQMVRNEIVTCLNEQEPRIFVENNDIDIYFDNLNMYIDINYNIRYTDYKGSYQYIVSILKED